MIQEEWTPSMRLVEKVSNKEANYICKDGTKKPLEWDDLMETFYTDSGLVMPEEFIRGCMDRSSLPYLRNLINYIENN